MNYFKHKTSIIDKGCKIGKGSKIWHWSHISKKSLIGQNCNLGQNVFVGENARGSAVDTNASIAIGYNVVGVGNFYTPFIVSLLKLLFLLLKQRLMLLALELL